MSDLAKYTRLKQKYEEAQRSVDKSKGALEQILQRIQTEFQCQTIEEAEEKLAELKSQRSKLKKKFNKELQKFEDNHGNLLDEV